MKTSPTTTSRFLIALTAALFLFSISLPVEAGQAKRSGKQHERQRTDRGDDSNRLSVPAPVVDDSPIKPDARSKNKSSGETERQKKRSRR